MAHAERSAIEIDKYNTMQYLDFAHMSIKTQLDRTQVIVKFYSVWPKISLKLCSMLNQILLKLRYELTLILLKLKLKFY